MTERSYTIPRDRRWIWLAGVMGLILCILGVCAFGDPPATQPADNSLTVGAADPVVEAKPERVAKWFNQLDDADPGVRADGYDKLMCLKSSDLDMLKGVVRKSLPLHPVQIAALPGIVKQLYLAGMDYDGNNSSGFMGVSLLERDGQQFVNPQFVNAPPVNNPHIGVMIGRCMPGFGGARLLRDGDVVLSIVERADVKIDGVPSLAEAVRNFPAGQTIHLTVLRQSRVIRVPVTLDARPSELQIAGNQEMAMQDMLRRREDAADDYWSKDFAPLFKPGPS